MDAQTWPVFVFIELSEQYLENQVVPWQGDYGKQILWCQSCQSLHLTV